MLRTIVTHPRATMRWILDHGDGGLWILLLLGLAAGVVVPFCFGMAALFMQPPEGAPGPRLDRGVVLACVGVAILVDLVALWIAARMLGGVGRWWESLAAIAWGSVPLVAVLPVVLMKSLFELSLPRSLSSALGLLVFLAGLGSGLLNVPTFAEAQRFSWRRSAASHFIAWLVVNGLAILVIIANRTAFLRWIGSSG